MELSQSLSLVQPHPAGENPAAKEQARAAALGVQPSSPRQISSGTVDASRFDLDHPEPYRFERTGPGYRLLIEGRRYSPLP